jgi:phage terminase large subunit
MTVAPWAKKQPKTYYDVRKAKARIQCHEGGTRSGKTYCITQSLVEVCWRNKGQKLMIDICRVNGPALEEGPMADFRDIMTKNEYWNPGWVPTRRKYNLWGNELRFFSIDQAYKMKGRKRHLLYLNEANRFPYDAWRQLFIRTSDRIIMDWNPDADDFWGYDLIEAGEAELFTSNYTHNPFLGSKIVSGIEAMKETDPWGWQVYGLGNRAANPLTIYSRWDVLGQLPEEVIDEQGNTREPEAKAIGLDFGFSLDPAALVMIYEGAGKEVYLEELLYETGFTNPALAARIKAILQYRELPANFPVVCDSAEMKSIQELRDAGINAYPAQKGPDSVRHGIQFCQQYMMHVIGSENLQKELRNYRWKQHANGKILREPRKERDHLMDAVRYGITWIYSSRYNAQYTIGAY